jgi:ATP-dependent DNA helicase DinG
MIRSGAATLDVLDRAVAALGGDERPGQRRLAEAVAAAIEGRHHLVAEAPTGSGKSLAYLAPVLASGARAVVATATLALQDQLWRKDLPHLHEHSGVAFSTALVKGRSNYLCLARLDAAQGGEALFDERPGPDFAADLERLERFAADADTGDVAELSDAVAPASWRAVTCGPNECPGAKRCAHGEDCFAELARARAAEADVVVVNHALYCAHLATGGVLLPEHDVVVIDEAHTFDGTATGALGTELSAAGLRQLAGRLRRADAPRADADAVAQVADRLDAALDDLDGRVDPEAAPLDTVLDALAERLAPVAVPKRDGEPSAMAVQAARLASARLEAVRRLRAPAEGEVVWVEGTERRSLQLAPVAIGGRLAPLLFAQVPTVMVSATLGPGARFEPLARRLGLDPDATPGPRSSARSVGTDDGDEDAEDDPPTRPKPGLGYVAEHVETPFDYKAQAMLYVPRHLPDPRQPDWQDAAADELCDLVTAAGGRTLVLCTSWRAVHAFAEVLGERTDHTVLRQGEEAAARLIEAFAADETSCLVATRAFWMGLDIPGPSCVLVVIDRLPFTRPDEPLEQARREAAEAAGGDGFRDVDLPATALVLAQGAGRLIRRRDDHGVVAVLDRRLATAGYRSVLLDALPPMKRVVDPEVAREFLEHATATAAAVVD